MTTITFNERSAAVSRYVARLRNAASFARWRLGQRLKHVARGLRYAAGCMTEDDAREMFGLCQHIAGWHPLEMLCVDDVLHAAIERWGDNPALRELAEDACARVAERWVGISEVSDVSWDCVMDKIVEYAEERGIELSEGTQAEFETAGEVG